MTDERRPLHPGAGDSPRFRRTPAHRQVLTLVRDGRIEWRAGVGPCGGFAPVDGARYSASDELVALYELRKAGLIGVAVETGRVYITASGLTRLAEWTTWPQHKAS